jgi:hypothetical protein
MLYEDESRLGMLSLLFGCVGLGLFVLIALGAVVVLIAYCLCADPQQTEVFRRKSSTPLLFKTKPSINSCHNRWLSRIDNIIAFVVDSAMVAFRMDSNSRRRLKFPHIDPSSAAEVLTDRRGRGKSQRIDFVTQCRAGYPASQHGCCCVRQWSVPKPRTRSTA